MTRLKAKTAAETVAAARDAVEATAMVARIGEALREQQLIQAALEEEVAAVKARAAALMQPHAALVRALSRSVQLWAEANRARLTADGRTKTVVLTSGRIVWRARPPSVRIASVPQVLVALNALGLDRFIRTRLEPDRQAMLAEPEVAGQVPGITIGSAGEDFAIEPDGVALGEVQG